MALVVPQSHEKKRVKVYELRNNDWFDRGTGFCTGYVINVGRGFFISLSLPEVGSENCVLPKACSLTLQLNDSL